MKEIDRTYEWTIEILNQQFLMSITYHVHTVRWVDFSVSIILKPFKQHCKVWNFINTIFTTIILNHSQMTLLCVGYIGVPNINNFSQQHDTTHFIILDWGLVRSGTKRYTFNIIQSNPPRFYKKNHWSIPKPYIYIPDIRSVEVNEVLFVRWCLHCGVTYINRVGVVITGGVRGQGKVVDGVAITSTRPEISESHSCK